MTSSENTGDEIVRVDERNLFQEPNLHNQVVNALRLLRRGEIVAHELSGSVRREIYKVSPDSLLDRDFLEMKTCRYSDLKEKYDLPWRLFYLEQESVPIEISIEEINGLSRAEQECLRSLNLVVGVDTNDFLDGAGNFVQEAVIDHFQVLNNCINLRRLCVIDYAPDLLEILSSLSFAGSLVELEFGSFLLEEIDNNYWSSFSSLKKLGFERTNIRSGSLKGISDLRSLKHISFDLCTFQSEEEVMKSLPSSLVACGGGFLEDLSGNRIELISHLVSLVNLQVELLSDDKSSCLEFLSALVGLEELHIVDEHEIIRDADLKFLANLKSLRSFHLDGLDRISVEGLRILSDLLYLEFLEIYSGCITDVEIEFISSLSGLKILMLDGSIVTDDDLIKLSKLSKLEELSFTDSVGFTCNGLIDLLSKLKFIKKVDICGSEISPEDIEKIGEIFPKLMRRNSKNNDWIYFCS